MAVWNCGDAVPACSVHVRVPVSAHTERVLRVSGECASERAVPASLARVALSCVCGPSSIVLEIELESPWSPESPLDSGP